MPCKEILDFDFANSVNEVLSTILPSSSIMIDFDDSLIEFSEI
jgi:hypothetical protein